MKIQYILLVFLFTIGGAINLSAQDDINENLVQFSGMTLDGSGNENQLYPIPYVNIVVKGKGRGTYSGFDGFFSIVVEKGDTILFSAIGYSNVEYIIPSELEDNRYSIIQLMTKDAINLPETVVFPWPSRDHFKLEFLAMDVTSEMQRYATENVANEALAQMRNDVPSDGVENTGFYLRQQAQKTYYVGQTPPMNIFNPVAWKDFFNAWQRGDFKKKD